MRTIRRLSALFVVLILSSTAMTSAFAASASQGQGGTVRVGYNLVKSGTGGFSFDPTKNLTPVADIDIYHWVYGGLMRKTPEGDFKPDLAKSVQVVDNNTIEVVLRDGITFPDGTKVDANVVKEAIEKNLTNPSLPAFKPQFFSLASIDVTAPNTLRFNIPDGTAPSWYDNFITGVETVVIPKNVDFDKPAGAGPFTVVENNPEQNVVLEKNPDYWAADEIKVGRIELIHVADSLAASAALRAGQIDIASLDYTSIDSVRGDFKLLVNSDPNVVSQAYICKTSKPTDDVRVRQALSFATDRQQISDALFDGLAAPAWDMWPEGHRLHNEALTNYYPHNPKKAKALLKKAGYPNGVTVDIIPAGGGNTAEVAEILKQQWAEAGITLNIVPTSNIVQDFFQSKRAQLANFAGGATRDRAKLNAVSGTSLSNVCQYSDPELDALIKKLSTLSDQSAEGVKAWADIQDKIVKDVLTLPLIFAPVVDAYNGDHLKNVAVTAETLRVPDIWQLRTKKT